MITVYFLLIINTHSTEIMSTSWPDVKLEVVDPLDSTYSDFLNDDAFELPIDAMFDNKNVPSNTTFDWSEFIDPSMCQLPKHDEVVLGSLTGSNCTSFQLSTEGQSTNHIVSELVNRFAQLEQDIGKRFAQIEENMEGMSKRLIKVEEAKVVHDAEYTPPKIPNIMERR
jgi:hypothetical protein